MQAGELTFQEILQARSIFAKNAEGKLKTANQLRNILSELGQHPSQSELDTVLATFGGKMSFEQVVRYLEFLKSAFMKPEPKDADTVRAFVALGGKDDRGGNVSADKLRTMCKMFDLTIDIDAMLREVDEDGSGAIDYGEFRTMWDESNAEPSVVSFQVEEDAPNEDEHLQKLRAHLLAEKIPEAVLQRQQSSIKRKQSGKSLVDQRAKSIARLPPIATTTSPAKSQQQLAETTPAEAVESDEEEQQPKPEETQRQVGNEKDATYRRYMMTDPIVVGARRGPKLTPRAPAAPLPTLTPRSGRRSGSKSPRKTATQ